MAQPYCPALAALGKNGINYVDASTSKPSDSFPGLTAIVTGGSPALHRRLLRRRVFPRIYDAPTKTTGNGVAAGPCTPERRPPERRPNMKKASTSTRRKVNGGAPGAALTDGGIASIDPQRLPDRDPSQRLQSRLPMGVRSRQQHLQRHSSGWRIRGLVRQASRILLRRFRHRAAPRSTISTRRKSTPTSSVFPAS